MINAFFPGQSGGEAITDVLFGEFNPGGRIPISVPYSVGTLPSFYSYKNTAHFRFYLDANWWPTVRRFFYFPPHSLPPQLISLLSLLLSFLHLADIPDSD